MSAARAAAEQTLRMRGAAEFASNVLRPPDTVNAAEGSETLSGGCPSDDRTLISEGQVWRGLGDVAQAARCYAAALDRNPDREETLLALGTIYLAAGRLAEAAPLLRRCCAIAPGNPQARHALGLTLLLNKEFTEALEVLMVGHALESSNALCSVHLADAAHVLGESATLADSFERERRQSPDNIGVLAGRATALAHLGRRDEAMDVLEAATLLQPDHPVVVPLYADMLARTTRQREAECALRRAIALDADNNDATMALSVVLMRLHRHVEAVAILEEMLARTDSPVGPLCNLATALVALGQQEDAVRRAREAIAVAPMHPAPYRALCNALPYHQDVTGASLLAATQACSIRQPRLSLPAFCNTPDAGRRLRLGLLSGTLRTHPVGWLTVAAFEHLDTSAFDIVCLSQYPPEDTIGRRFAQTASLWEDIGSLDDRQLAERARELEIDILIDLGGYGDLGRMPAVVHRLAPVQIKWVGMQNHSTGLPEMDWYITDRWETPAGSASLYSERLLQLPDGYVCYSPPSYAPDVAPLPALASRRIRFGCYNNLAKITPVVIATWCRILHGSPDAGLILKAHQFNNAGTRADLIAKFQRHGIGAERLSLRGSSPHRDLLAQYAEIDIVLDPFPYSGGLTTCEALWMGVPTLTMPGDTFASRHSASHMSNVGLENWVVPNLESYVARAVESSRNLGPLAALRSGLRERVRRSPLCDAPRFGLALGNSLRGAWADWCCGDRNRHNVKTLF